MVTIRPNRGDDLPVGVELTAADRRRLRHARRGRPAIIAELRARGVSAADIAAALR